MTTFESPTLIEDEQSGDRRWNFESTDPREIMFKHLVEDQIMQVYENDLKSIGVNKESLANLEDALIDESFTERDREIFYCIPYELRLVQFKYALPPVSPNKVITTEEWVVAIKELIDINKDSDPHLGFHVSPHEISKVKKAQTSRTIEGKRESWDIHGTEMDDRDNKKMAYYSLSIEKLFTKKGLKYIYIVRGNLAKGFNNFPDNNGHWGRAASLSIIHRLDLKGQSLNDMLAHMEEQINSIENKKGAE